MAESLKNYPPSPIKIQRLRLAGIIPWSGELMVFAVIAGIFAGLFLFAGIFYDDFMEFARAAFQRKFSEAEFATIRPALLQVVKGGAIFFLPLLGLLFLVGGFQTRFLFTIDPLVPRASRLFGINPAYGWRFMKTLCSVILALLWLLLLALFVSYVFSAQFFGDTMKFADSVQSAWSGAPENALSASLGAELGRLLWFFTTFFIVAIGLSFFIGVLSRFIAVIGFQHAHRMTRAEMEEELRETEASLAFRDARRERIEEGR